MCLFLKSFSEAAFEIKVFVKYLVNFLGVGVPLAWKG